MKRLQRAAGNKSFRTLYICTAFDLVHYGASVIDTALTDISNVGLTHGNPMDPMPMDADAVF